MFATFKARSDMVPNKQHPTRFLVPTKQHPRYKKYMFATLAKSMDKSRTDHNANKLEALVL